MRPDRLQTGKAPRKSFAAALTLFAALCSGCANPGPPKPPSLHLPAVVKDLVAERSGDQVLLHWTTSSRTTDDMDIKGSLTAELCREVGDHPSAPAARAAACLPVRRLPVAPGTSQVSDTLPPTLQSDPPALITYRVKIFNATGHSAGDSAAAYAATGAAPPAIDSLQATAGERGSILEWRTSSTSPSGTDFVDIKRVDISSPAEKEIHARPAERRSAARARSSRSPKPEEPSSGEVHLRAANTAATRDAAGAVDTDAVMGETYTYSAQRVRTLTLGDRALEIRSAPSATVTLALRDTFPPRPPTGLAAISGVSAADAANSGAAGAYVDLSWEANSETDLAGYRVYRQLGRPDGSPQGPLARLTTLPIAAPAYRDVAVKPGQGYIYTVTAVDAAGNESAPSAKALETIPPDAGEPPH